MKVRRAAAWALGQIGDPQATPALIQALQDEEWVVRQAAARALEQIGDPQATPALIQALRDEKGVAGAPDGGGGAGADRRPPGHPRPHPGAPG
jgi:HEAT repeat protein